jgi:hypothetical protein
MDETKFKETGGLHSGRRSRAPTSHLWLKTCLLLLNPWWKTNAKVKTHKFIPFKVQTFFKKFSSSFQFVLYLFFKLSFHVHAHLWIMCVLARIIKALIQKLEIWFPTHGVMEALRPSIYLHPDFNASFVGHFEVIRVTFCYGKNPMGGWPR